MPAILLDQLPALTIAVAALQSRGFDVETAQASAIGPTIVLSPATFRRVFAGRDVVVWHGAHCDDYVLVDEGIRYTAKDFDRHGNGGARETIRLPDADAVAAK